jgi:DNA-binding transcriptional ArsR family regulator
MKVPKKTQDIYLPTSVLQDASKEPLKIILTPYRGITHVPFELGNGDTATLVFVELQKCFKKAGNVSEGLLSNIIWGFEQCGYDPRAVASGLTKLRELGYVYYSDERGERVTEQDFNPKVPLWIRYTDKMTSLFVRSSILSI